MMTVMMWLFKKPPRSYTHTHTHKQKSHVQYRRSEQQKALSISLEWEQSHLRGGSCCISFCAGILDSSSWATTQKESNVFSDHRGETGPPSAAIFLTMSTRAQSSSAQPTDGWTERPNLPPALIQRTLLRDKIEHSSIINRLTVTLCHNNNPVTQGRDELKSSSTPHHRDVDDGLMLARSGRVYRQGRLKGVRCAISWEEMGTWRDLTFTDPSRSSQRCVRVPSSCKSRRITPLTSLLVKSWKAADSVWRHLPSKAQRSTNVLHYPNQV